MSGCRLLERAMLGVAVGESPLAHVEFLPSRPGRRPVGRLDSRRPALAAGVQVADAPAPAHPAATAWEEAPVVLATGTGSGESLAHQLPGLATSLVHDRARVLCVAPIRPRSTSPAQPSGTPAGSAPGIPHQGARW